MLTALICVSIYSLVMTVLYCVVKHTNKKIVKEVLNLKDIAEKELEKLENLKKEAEIMARIEQQINKKFEYVSNPLHSDIWK